MFSRKGDNVSSNLATPLTAEKNEDPHLYLPRSRTTEHKEGQVIYGPDHPSESLYLIVGGKVKVQWIADDGDVALVDVYRTGEFFGESALIGAVNGHERAVALETRTHVMSWTYAQVEALIMRQPRLGIALLQMLVERCIHSGRRIESFSIDKTDRRLARTLVDLSERLGEDLEDGSIQIVSMTHKLLAQYVGVSREVVTTHMNQFRRDGYVNYSRKSILLYPDEIRKSLGPSD